MKIYLWCLFGFIVHMSGKSVAQRPSHTAAMGRDKPISSTAWTLLADVKFVVKNEYSYPQFGEKVKAQNQKTIELEGYMFAFENTRWSVHFGLSSLPLSTCFFCGVGGPETVVEVEAAQPIRQSDKPIRIRGTLVLNATDTEKMIYILKNAVQIGK